MNAQFAVLGIGGFAVSCICSSLIVLLVYFMFFYGKNDGSAPAPNTSPPPTEAAQPAAIPSPQSSPGLGPGDDRPTFQSPVFIAKSPGSFNPYDVSPGAINNQRPGQGATLPTLIAVINGLTIAKDPYNSEITKAALGAFGARLILKGQTEVNTNQEKPFDVAEDLPGTPEECIKWYNITEETATCSALQCGKGLRKVKGVLKPGAPSNCKTKSSFMVDCYNKASPECCFEQSENVCLKMGQWTIHRQKTEQSSLKGWEYCKGTKVVGEEKDVTKTCNASELQKCGEYAADWDLTTCKQYDASGNNPYGVKTKAYGGDPLPDGTYPSYCILNGKTWTVPCTAEDVLTNCKYDYTTAAVTNCARAGLPINVGKTTESPQYCANSVYTCTQEDYNNSIYKLRDALACPDSIYDYAAARYKCDAVGKKVQVDKTGASPGASQCPATMTMTCSESDHAELLKTCQYDNDRAMAQCREAGEKYPAKLLSGKPGCPPTSTVNCPPIYFTRCLCTAPGVSPVYPLDGKNKFGGYSSKVKCILGDYCQKEGAKQYPSMQCNTMDFPYRTAANVESVPLTWSMQEIYDMQNAAQTARYNQRVDKVPGKPLQEVSC